MTTQTLVKLTSHLCAEIKYHQIAADLYLRLFNDLSGEAPLFGRHAKDVTIQQQIKRHYQQMLAYHNLALNEAKAMLFFLEERVHLENVNFLA